MFRENAREIIVSGPPDHLRRLFRSSRPRRMPMSGRRHSARTRSSALKIIKPQTLSLLTRPFEFRREFWLGISVIAFLPIGETPVSACPRPRCGRSWPRNCRRNNRWMRRSQKCSRNFWRSRTLCARRRRGAASVSTGIQLGPLIKTLDVFGDRQHDGRQVSEPVRSPVCRSTGRGPMAAEVADNPLGKGAAPLDGTEGACSRCPISST